MHHPQQSAPRGLAAVLRTPQGAALAAVLTAALIYLLVEHTAHVLGVLPYGLVLLCPLMHLFMMRGMHHGHGEQHDNDARGGDNRQDEGPKE